MIGTRREQQRRIRSVETQEMRNGIKIIIASARENSDLIIVLAEKERWG